MNRCTYRIAGLLCVALAAWLCAEPAQAQPRGVRHPYLHLALNELREARTELQQSKTTFNGHRDKALVAVDAAIREIDRTLRASLDNLKSVGPVDPVTYAKYPVYPHMHHAIVELIQARDEMRKSSFDFTGHRNTAIRDMNFAIEQLELALINAR